MNKLKEIEKLKTKLNSLQPFTSGEQIRLKEEFVIEFTYDSNAIEGSTLTLNETALVLKENITINKKPLSDHLAAIGHKDAYFYIESLVEEKEVLTENQILNIHSLVLMDRPEDNGRYRNLPVRIMGTNAVLSEPFMIKKHMEELLNWYYNEKELNLLEKLTLFHLKLETIHPFIDGNGRTGRLILNLELMKNGYVPINIKNKDKQKYYDAFKLFNENNNHQLMLELICDNLIEELNKLLKIRK